MSALTYTIIGALAHMPFESLLSKIVNGNWCIIAISVDLMFNNTGKSREDDNLKGISVYDIIAGASRSIDYFVCLCVCVCVCNAFLTMLLSQDLN